jgi:hypothetical protein
MQTLKVMRIGPLCRSMTSTRAPERMPPGETCYGFSQRFRILQRHHVIGGVDQGQFGLGK